MSSDAASHDPPPDELPIRSGVSWLLAGPVLIAVLAIAGANAPARVKGLGLFAVAFGLLAGGILGWLAQGSRRDISWKSVLIAGLLIASGEILMSLESHRIYAARYEERFRQSQAEWMTAPAITGTQRGTGNQPSDGSFAPIAQLAQRAQRAQFLEQTLADNTRFSTYLQLRVSSLGSWPSPWPMLFWIGELLLGTLSGSWLFRKQTRGNQSPVPIADPATE